MSNRSLFAFLSIALIACVASLASAQTTQPAVQRIKLWDVAPGIVAGPDSDTDPTEPTMDIYLPPPATASGAAMVIFPGGGYTHLSTVREGSDVAKMLVSHNVAAFVVRYRHALRYQYPIPIDDGFRAIRIVRTNAAQYGVDPHRIGVIGFSAGGHMAATMATLFDAGKPDAADPIDRASSRPDFAALLYPVITFTDEQHMHKGSRDALVGTHAELFPQLSAELHVTRNTPPIFLAHSTQDMTVPVENSILFYEACHKNRVPVEMHLFEIGGHGFGLAPTDPALSVWPQLLVNWMTKNKWLKAAPAATPAR